VGVLIVNANGNRIGGDTAAERNVISGNQKGVEITDNGIGADSNLVLGNYIGLAENGLDPVPNTRVGVTVTGTNTVIGGSTNVVGTPPGNVISGNSDEQMPSIRGVELLGAKYTTIQGNIIGADAGGTKSVGNSGDGVYVSTSDTTWIGGNATSEGNLISGNDENGVHVRGASWTWIRGNLIGSDRSGLAPIENFENGVSITGEDENTMIGGDASTTDSRQRHWLDSWC
jgi:titin